MTRRTTRDSRPELTTEQQAVADRIHAAMLYAAAPDFRELAELLATKGDSNLFGVPEFTVRDIVLRVGARAIETALKERKEGHGGSSRTRPHRIEPAKFQRWRAKSIVTVLGRVRPSRVYYHCKHCQSGHCPRDVRLGLGGSGLSRGASEAAALAGALSSFAEALQRTLPKLRGSRLDEPTVERVAERVGMDVGDRLAAGETFGKPGRWEWSRDADGRSCAYVGGPDRGGHAGGNGRAAEGRMTAVGMVWNPGA